MTLLLRDCVELRGITMTADKSLGAVFLNKQLEILRVLLYLLVPGRHARSKALTMPHLHIVSIEKEFTLDQ